MSETSVAPLLRMIGQLKVRLAANRRRGKANSTDKLHSEMSIEDYLEHAAKSRVMAEHPEFDDIANAPLEVKQRFETLVTAKRNELNETYFE